MHIEHMWHLFDCAALKFRHFAAASSQVTVSSDLWVHIHFKKNLLFSQSSSKHKQLQGTFNNTCILSMLHYMFLFLSIYAAINQKLKNHSNLNTIQHYSYDFWFVLLAVNVKWSVYTSFFDRQTYYMYIQCNCSAVCEISLTIVCDFKLLIKFVRYSSGINSQFWVEPQHVVE